MQKTYTLSAPIDGLDKKAIAVLKFKELTGADAIQIERSVPKDAGGVEYMLHELAQASGLDIVEVQRMTMRDIQAAVAVMREVNPTENAGE